ncbi:MAG: DUF4383 domain-containing protein [Euryarchaeota archaeon]|nr:DUF4383 domain-containing protein [Euryarchaeota archaeon]
MNTPILNPKNYAKITGIAIAAVALLGIVLSLMGTSGNYGLFCDGAVTCTTETGAQGSFLGFDWTHNIVHVVLAAVALYVGFMATGNLVPLYAKVFGIVYAALGVFGFIVADLGILHLELGENLVHLVIGVWGVCAGFLYTTTTGTPTMAATPTTASKPPARK